ncbi:serine hydrolase [Pararhodobacter zhoushanensis]|uniref:serine hydrolase n=1 Tax=Pararhodobacter zhoushanensis TaxID=2479545 RepID=UPI000F8DD15D|nr:serine hydrolase [Pararhodobacter zhoushanensis]
MCAWSVAVFCAAILATGMPMRAVAQPYSAVIMDVRTGEILQETDNSTARLHPASLTKMMTLYIAFEALENGEITLDTRVRISQHAAAQPPSRLGLRAGQTISFRYLIRAAALRSANDSAVAIAEALEGSVSAFATRMNRTARAIGMTSTHFRNPHGLTSEGHYSSARDMSRLGRQLYFDFPQYYNIFSRRSEDAGIATVNNTNRRFLNGYRGADGIKTGFTSAAGYNLTAMAERNGVRILVTAMGNRSSTARYNRVVELMDRGFRLAPRRAAVHRPSRPSYVPGSDDRGSGVAAGRVIRLQTAPTTSRFPRRRPQPGDAPSDDLIAALRDGIDEVIDDIREPDSLVDIADSGVLPGVSSEESEEGEDAIADVAEEATVLVAAAAPERSPLPRARPEEALAALAPADETETAGMSDTGVEVARAAGFSIIDPEQYAALTETDAVPAVTPAPRPEELAALVAATAPTSPDQFEHDADAVAEVQVADHALTIPGLPPIALDQAAAAQPTEMIAAAAAAPSPDAGLPAIEPAAVELAVDDEGRVLWRDEELLQALDHENPEDPVLTPAIVLTSASDADPAPIEAPMPEIVTRVSTSGGRLWRVELGRFGSPFDAERTLLRIALSESTTLSTGVRRVATRGGRYVAEVNSLSQEQAEMACTRLIARDHDCTVVAPEG